MKTLRFYFLITLWSVVGIGMQAQNITLTATIEQGGVIQFRLGGTGTLQVDWGDGVLVEAFYSHYPSGAPISGVSKSTSDACVVKIYGENITEFHMNFPNTITALDVSNSPALVSLGFRSELLTSLDLSKNTALSSLSCSYSGLTSLDLSKNTVLNSLNCSYSRLTSLDLSQNLLLTNLSCHSNQLTSLIMGNNPELKVLECFDNHLTSLDVSQSTKLTNLICYSNQLTSLDVSKVLELSNLECYANRLTVLDVAANIKLSNLNCNGNQLTSLDVSKNTALQSLGCASNQLTTLDLSYNQALRQLICNSNRLTTLGPLSNLHFVSLSCYDNRLPLSTLYHAGKDYYPNSYYPGVSINVKYFGFQQPVFFETKSLPIGGRLNLNSEAVFENVPTVFTVKKASADAVQGMDYTIEGGILTFLQAGSYTVEMTNPVIESNSTEYPTKVVTGTIVVGEDIDPHGISFVADILPGNPIEFSMGGSGTAHIDWGDGVLQPHSITSAGTLLSGVNKNISEPCVIDIYGADIQLLSIKNQQVTTLNVSRVPGLSSLDCSSNQLKGLDISLNQALSSLDCSSNQLKGLDISPNQALSSLDCSSNQLKGLDISLNQALSSLDCSSNQLKGLDISLNQALTTLSCYDNLMLLSALYEAGKSITNASDKFLGTQQPVLFEAKVLPLGSSLDLRGEAFINGSSTVFTVKKGTSVATEGVDYTNSGGTILFLKKGDYTVEMTNPIVTGNDAYPTKAITGIITIALQSNNQSIAFTTAKSSGETIRFSANFYNSYPPANQVSPMFIDWGDGNLQGYIFYDQSRKEIIGTNKSASGQDTVKIYCDYIYQFSIEDQSLTSLICESSVLWKLECKNNLLTTLDVSNSPELDHLNCNNNLLTSLDVSHNSLHTLSCNSNRFTSLITGGNSFLTLDCFDNRLPLSVLYDAGKNLNPSLVEFGTQYSVFFESKSIPVGGIVDLSSEVSFGGSSTYFTVIKGTENATEGTDYTISGGIATFLQAGSYTIEMVNDILKDNSVPLTLAKAITGVITVQGEATPPAVWTPIAGLSDAEQQDWKDARNWSTGVVPDATTDVYIPGDRSHYPVLSGNASDYVCNNIYFMQGGEIGQIQKLTYKRAHVQLNAGLENPASPQAVSGNNHLSLAAKLSSPAVARNKYHMLSAPLHNMVAGDFSFGNFPRTFMKKFDQVVPGSTKYSKGEWSATFGTFGEELKIGEGFVVWINKWQEQSGYLEYANTSDTGMATREYGIQQTNGILEFPYYADTTMSRAHRIHTAAGEQSTFHYISSTAPIYPFTGSSETYSRGANDQAYRFITESYNGSQWVFPATHTVQVNNEGLNKVVLLGNPYMSSLDFDVLYQDNSEKMKDYYRVWVGDRYATYTIGIVPDPADFLTGYISPIQSFFVETLASATPVDIAFNVANLSTTRPISTESNLRSTASGDKQSNNLLRVKASNEASYSSACIVQREGANNAYDPSKDIFKLFSNLGKVPEVYFLADDHPVEYKYVNGDKMTIPVGLKTDFLGATTFKLTGMDSYTGDVEFIDMATNLTVPVTDTQEYSYTFTNEVAGALEGRFFIRLSPASTTGSEDISSESGVKIYGFNQTISVLSSVSNPIREVIVCDVQGRIVYKNSRVNSTLLTVPVTTGGIYIVKAVTESGVQIAKVLL